MSACARDPHHGVWGGWGAALGLGLGRSSPVGPPTLGQQMLCRRMRGKVGSCVFRYVHGVGDRWAGTAAAAVG